MLPLHAKKKKSTKIDGIPTFPGITKTLHTFLPQSFVIVILLLPVLLLSDTDRRPLGLSCNLGAIISCPSYYFRRYTLQKLLTAAFIYGGQLFGQHPSTLMESSLSINVHIWTIQMIPLHPLNQEAKILHNMRLGSKCVYKIFRLKRRNDFPVCNIPCFSPSVWIADPGDKFKSFRLGGNIISLQNIYASHKVLH